jgi:aromatic-L-amino-acid decarboxylase
MTSVSSQTLLPALGDLDPDQFQQLLHQVADWAVNYRASIGDRQISPNLQPGNVSSRLPAEIPARGVSIESLLSEFERLIVPNVVHWGHPAFLGYFGCTTTAPGILGELMAATLNVSAMTWATSPAATELEAVVLKWLRQMLHLPDQFFGVVYDTASVATMHALAAAREQLPLNIRALGLAGREDVPRLRIYVSEHTHSSVIKAAITLGIGEANVKRVACDAGFRMKVNDLRQAIEHDRTAGYLPMCVVATVGTTSCTAVDPILEIAALCRDEHIWLHVDAAYGGAMALLPEGRQLFAGVELADSVVVNPHKWLLVPLDFSALYTRHPEQLRAVFSLVPEYLRGDAEQGEINYMDYGIQLGRRFRALKAWMVFSAFGEEGLVQRIRENIRLARLFASWVESDEDFELLAPVEMAVVCFRVLWSKGDEVPISAGQLNTLNKELVRHVNSSGRAYLTHTILGDKVALRIAVGNVLTTEEHLREVFDLLQNATKNVAPQTVTDDVIHS